MKAYLVKAFTQNKNEGNPAGVILEADDLTDKEMIEISAKLGFSESAFVQKSDKADYKIRFFTPMQEVGLCGHATIATFHVLKELKKIIVITGGVIKTQESGAGTLPVTVYDDCHIMMTQSNPIFADEELDRKLIAQLLNIETTHLLSHPIQSVSTGASKLIIPLDSLKTLFSIKPDLEGIKEYSQKTQTRGFYPFTFETLDNDSDFHARNFNPLVGINEDPITGVAAGALGAYIVKHKLLDKKKFTLEQGYCMNKPGKIMIDLTDKVQVGGYAVIYEEREL